MGNFSLIEHQEKYSKYTKFGYGHQYDLSVAVAFLVLTVFGKLEKILVQAGVELDQAQFKLRLAMPSTLPKSYS
jgi:hypothetical protein